MNEAGLIIVSNLSFVIPITIALLVGYYQFAILILAVMICSIWYHSTQWRDHGRGLILQLDYLFGIILVAVNIIFLFNGHFHDNLYFYLALAFSVLAIRMWFKNNDEYYKHAYWHILSSIVTLFCLLTALTR